MNVFGQPLLCSSKTRSWQKVRSMNVSTQMRNGISSKCNANNMRRSRCMSKKTWERNTTGLVAHAHQRHEEKQKRVEEAIAGLLQERKPINFNTVALAAGVSKAYLYQQLPFRERIEALRQQDLEYRVRQRI